MITLHGPQITRKQLDAIPLERPKGAGSVWAGTKFSDVVDILEDSVYLQGWKPTSTKFAVSANQGQLAVAMGVQIKGLELPGMDLSLGLLHSNDRSRKLTVVCGAEVIVCNNGMATGHQLLRRKHCKGLDFMDELEPALRRYGRAAESIPGTVAALQAHKMHDSDVDRILTAAARKDLMNWGRMGMVDAEYRKPRHEEHGTGTAWALLMAFTEIVKRQMPLTQMDRIIKFKALMPTLTA